MDARSVVDGYYEFLNKGDLDGAISLFDESYQGHWGLGSGGGGADTVRAHLRQWYTAVPDMRFDVLQTITDGNWVSSFLVVRGTQTGPFGEIPASGNEFQMGGVDNFRVENGKIVEGRTICDLGSLFMAAGAVKF